MEDIIKILEERDINSIVKISHDGWLVATEKHIQSRSDIEIIQNYTVIDKPLLQLENKKKQLDKELKEQKAEIKKTEKAIKQIKKAKEVIKNS